jgi:uncharacterized SAM-binding protein YcdF (DUF218 family)
VTRRRRTVAIVAVLILLVFGIVTDRLFVHPAQAPLPLRVDAIVELGGSGMAGRDALALELARAHRAPYLMQSTVAAESGTERCLPPVPEVTVLCFHPAPDTTRGEARYIAAEAARLHWKSVVLVTTPDQAWRARLRTSRCFGGQVYTATSDLPTLDWLGQIPYQWGATLKALVLERSC